MNVVQVSLLGIAGVLLAIQLKQQKAEFAIYLCVAISLIIFFHIFQSLTVLVDTIKEWTFAIDLDQSYITTMLKMLGVTYVAEFSTSICKDAGYQTLASQIEICSKVTILVLALPIIGTLFQTITSFLST